MDEYTIVSQDSELYHWGIKGMKWGVRRYQNKDGSLTAAGKKKYSDSEGSGAAPKKKVSRKVQRQRKKALEKARAAKAVKDAEKKEKEELRKELLESSDPKKLYDNRHLLSTAELNDRLNRINTEIRLSQAQDMMDKAAKDKVMDRVNTALQWGRKANEIYEFATGSKAGKDLMKALGIGAKESSEFNLKDFYENINKKSTQEVMDANKRIMAAEKIKKAYDEAVAKEQADNDAKAAEKQAKQDAKAAEKAMKKAQKQVDDYNERWQQDGADDSVASDSYSRTSDQINYGKEYTRNASIFLEGPTMNTVNSSSVDRGRSEINNSQILDATITYDSDGTTIVRYDRD